MRKYTVLDESLPDRTNYEILLQWEMLPVACHDSPKTGIKICPTNVIKHYVTKYPLDLILVPNELRGPQ